MKQHGRSTLAIKAKIVNELRSKLYNLETKQIVTGEDISVNDKAKMFDQILSRLQETHVELFLYKSKRKAKNLVIKKRWENGYMAKKATKQADHANRVLALNMAIKNCKPEQRDELIATYRKQYINKSA